MRNPILSDAQLSFSVFFVDTEPKAVQQLETMLVQSFPNLEVKGSATDHQMARRMIEAIQPDIIFFDRW